MKCGRPRPPRRQAAPHGDGSSPILPLIRHPAPPQRPLPHLSGHHPRNPPDGAMGGLNHRSVSPGTKPQVSSAEPRPVLTRDCHLSHGAGSQKPAKSKRGETRLSRAA